MGFVEAVKSCFINYVTFSGRASRSEFWYFYLFGILLGIVTGILDVMIMPTPEPGMQPHNGPINALASLATLLPSLAVTSRRLHDTNRSFWWILIAFTIIGLIPLLIWYCTRGTKGDNRFGADPLPGVE
ncbi:MAG: DUF805 domain-containing protein [Rickettsiales bacterium]